MTRARRTSPMRLALATVALVVAIGSGWASNEPTKLLREEALANEACRDGSGEHATAAACDLRDMIDADLKRVGWCHGRPGEVESQMTWHPCGR